MHLFIFHAAPDFLFLPWSSCNIIFLLHPPWILLSFCILPSPKCFFYSSQLNMNVEYGMATAGHYELYLFGLYPIGQHALNEGTILTIPYDKQLTLSCFQKRPVMCRNRMIKRRWLQLRQSIILMMLYTSLVTWDMRESLDIGKIGVWKMEHGQMGRHWNVKVS